MQGWEAVLPDLKLQRLEASSYLSAVVMEELEHSSCDQCRCPIAHQLHQLRLFQLPGRQHARVQALKVL